MTERIDTRRVFSDPVLWLAFGFGSGLSPRAPGTAGTLVAVPLFLLLDQLSFAGYLTATVLISLAGVWICQRASQTLGVHDHPGIVWDEFAGYLVAMIMAPEGWTGILAGFVLFRFFDIWKPWPIGWVDKKVHGGLGIMLDDILAGLMVVVVLWVAKLVV
ncbi:phosphatidylglycerophosphatase A [Thiogranum longum]|uniref:Phosphatidylglycerophosphatase A n=1 Tax=Thiogranum longum TaxID=1537524 RepID=A0A4R1HA68_9GAMM|nr:phosphatidylglycerophosphatase A [Thiogranum longum]TCK17441.1 phosphatidylglycerophosphatase A [Thiogranum longum]